MGFLWGDGILAFGIMRRSAETPLRLSRNHAVETEVFAWSFCVRTSSCGAARSMKDMLRASLLALRKNPLRNHLRFYCMVTA